MKAHQLFKELGYKMTIAEGVPIYFKDRVSITVNQNSVLVKFAKVLAKETDYSCFILGKGEIEAIKMQMDELNNDQ